MAFSRGSRHPSRIATRRKTAWGVGPQAADLAISASGKFIWTIAVALQNEPAATLVRIRGLMSLTQLTTSAAGEGFFGALGIGIAADTAVAAGTASLPGPLSEQNWPGWMFHQFFDIRSITATIADGVNSPLHQSMVIDTKAMRKMGQDENLFAIVEVVESGTATLEIHGDTRVLVKMY